MKKIKLNQEELDDLIEQYEGYKQTYRKWWTYAVLFIIIAVTGGGYEIQWNLLPMLIATLIYGFIAHIGLRVFSKTAKLLALDIQENVKYEAISVITSYNKSKDQIRLEDGFTIDCYALYDEWELNRKIIYSFLPNSKSIVHTEIEAIPEN